MIFGTKKWPKKRMLLVSSDVKANRGASSLVSPGYLTPLFFLHLSDKATAIIKPLVKKHPERKLFQKCDVTSPSDKACP